MPLHCQSCGEPVSFDEPIPRDASCEGCGTDLRACIQCRHYDVSRNNQCTEPEADPVADKTRRNFCEFFYFSREKQVRPAAGDDRAAVARKKLDALFGGGRASAAGHDRAAVGDRAAEARRKLDALFEKKKRSGLDDA